MARIYNFSAGPAVLPEEVLQEAQAELVDFKGAATDFATPRVAAALVAAAVAFATRSTLKTLGAGMAALWLLQAALR